jgi:predicted GIY-YIG superfamily endonuclease
MYYTYILESINHPKHHYIGYTTNLKERVKAHNTGKNPSTIKYAPWKLKQYCGFDDHLTAMRFEKYLKTGSGYEFIHRHFGI